MVWLGDMTELRNKGISPAVSVVIPFRNAEVTLADCLDSLQAQTFADFEALLIDDGSEDSSTAFVLERTLRDNRLRLISPGRIGLITALNLGIAQSRADLIARMDADDIMSPERLKLQRELLLGRPDIAVAGCQVELFPDDAVRDGYREYIRWQNGCVDHEDIAGNIYVESVLAHPSVMMRKSAIDEVGGYRDGPFPEDYELWLRLHHAGFRMAKVPRVLLSWRESPDRTSRVDGRYSRDAFDRLRARYLAVDPRLRSGRPIVIWGGGRSTRLRVKHLLSNGVAIQAWIDVDPGRIGMTIWGMPVHPVTWLDCSDRPFVLAYVTNHGARDEISRVLDGWGYIRGRDYLAVG
jgi:glycosyltransferase involved in cell wall biosynthesis